MKKYTSDYTTLELIKMGAIDDGIAELVTLLTNLGIKTTSSCEGHINNPKYNCQYPYIDFEHSGLLTMAELISNYKNSSTILIQHRKYEYSGKKVRIFPYCENLKEGQEIFKDFTNYIKNYIKQ